MWIDTHCHFDVADFDADRPAVAAQAAANGVRAIVIPGYLADRWSRLFEVCASLDVPRMLPAPGLHPCYIREHRPEHLAMLESRLKSDRCIAVGEIGLDTYVGDIRQGDLYQRQQAFFIDQLALAKRFGKPVILHVRKAHADVFRLIRGQKFDMGGIVHAFSGGVEEARMYVRLGFRLGIGGSVTYDQAKRLHAVVAAMPIESLVIETDAPDIIPRPYRDPAQAHTRNSPAYLPCIAEALSIAKRLPLPELSERLWRNSSEALRHDFGPWPGDPEGRIAC